jgi:hypothetical protein
MKQNQLSYEEFVKKAILTLRRPGFKGIHSLYSGFNDAFKSYYIGDNPEEIINRLAAEGKIIVSPSKDGVLLHLPSSRNEGERKYPNKPPKVNIRRNTNKYKKDEDDLSIILNNISFPDIPELPDELDQETFSDNFGDDSLQVNNQPSDDSKKNSLLDIFTGISPANLSDSISDPQTDNQQTTEQHMAKDQLEIIKFVKNYFSIRCDIKESYNGLRMYTSYKSNIILLTVSFNEEILIKAFLPYKESASIELINQWSKLDCPGIINKENKGGKDFFTIEAKIDKFHYNNKNDLISFIDKILDSAKSICVILEK